VTGGRKIDPAALVADESPEFPTAAAFRVLDMHNNVVARVGDTSDAGPAIQFFIDGKWTASYGYMNLSMRARKSDRDRVYLGLRTNGNEHFPQLWFYSKDAHFTADLTSTDQKGGLIKLFDKDGKPTFEKP
jgi:hypothetical protein